MQISSSLAGMVLAAALASQLAVGSAGSPRAAAESNIEAGREIFEANCAMCHGAEAEGMMGMHPSLRGAVDRLSREGVEVTIRNGRDTTPPMPAFGGRLTDAQISSVIAYIDSLPEGPRNFGPGDGMMDRQGTSNGNRMMDNGMMNGMMGRLGAAVGPVAARAYRPCRRWRGVARAEHAPSQWRVEWCHSAFGRSC